MISINDLYEVELEAEQYLRARDLRAERRVGLPADYKFDRLPRGCRTNEARRKRGERPIRGINHRRNRKIK